MLDSYAPRVCIRRLPQAVDRARAPMDYSTGNSGVPQKLYNRINRVTFSDGTEIDDYPFLSESHGVVFGIQLQQVHAGSGARFLDFVRLRHSSCSTHETPAVDQWTDGDIESASCLLVELPCAL